uniref:Uncharacterized protein n=1 Tax=Parascaris univalens TaxID=6257 RepID=A0A915A340_PARUN
MLFIYTVAFALLVVQTFIIISENRTTADGSTESDDSTKWPDATEVDKKPRNFERSRLAAGSDSTIATRLGSSLLQYMQYSALYANGTRS